jgi:hypothetical protein
MVHTVLYQHPCMHAEWLSAGACSPSAVPVPIMPAHKATLVTCVVNIARGVVERRGVKPLAPGQGNPYNHRHNKPQHATAQPAHGRHRTRVTMFKTQDDRQTDRQTDTPLLFAVAQRCRMFSTSRTSRQCRADVLLVSRHKQAGSYVQCCVCVVISGAAVCLLARYVRGRLEIGPCTVLCSSLCWCAGDKGWWAAHAYTPTIRVLPPHS